MSPKSSLYMDENNNINNQITDNTIFDQEAGRRVYAAFESLGMIKTLDDSEANPEIEVPLPSTSDLKMVVREHLIVAQENSQIPYQRKYLSEDDKDALSLEYIDLLNMLTEYGNVESYESEITKLVAERFSLLAEEQSMVHKSANVVPSLSQVSRMLEIASKQKEFVGSLRKIAENILIRYSQTELDENEVDVEATVKHAKVMLLGLIASSIQSIELILDSSLENGARNKLRAAAKAKRDAQFGINQEIPEDKEEENRDEFETLFTEEVTSIVTPRNSLFAITRQVLSQQISTSFTEPAEEIAEPIPEPEEQGESEDTGKTPDVSEPEETESEDELFLIVEIVEAIERINAEKKGKTLNQVDQFAVDVLNAVQNGFFPLSKEDLVGMIYPNEDLANMTSTFSVRVLEMREKIKQYIPDFELKYDKKIKFYDVAFNMTKIPINPKTEVAVKDDSIVTPIAKAIPAPIPESPYEDPSILERTPEEWNRILRNEKLGGKPTEEELKKAAADEAEAYIAGLGKIKADAINIYVLKAQEILDIDYAAAEIVMANIVKRLDKEGKLPTESWFRTGNQKVNTTLAGHFRARLGNIKGEMARTAAKISGK